MNKWTCLNEFLHHPKIVTFPCEILLLSGIDMIAPCMSCHFQPVVSSSWVSDFLFKCEASIHLQNLFSIPVHENKALKYEFETEKKKAVGTEEAFEPLPQS